MVAKQPKVRGDTTATIQTITCPSYVAKVVERIAESNLDLVEQR